VDKSTAQIVALANTTRTTDNVIIAGHPYLYSERLAVLAGCAWNACVLMALLLQTCPGIMYWRPDCRCSTLGACDLTGCHNMSTTAIDVESGHASGELQL
jgi:hypothetical protein